MESLNKMKNYDFDTFYLLNIINFINLLFKA